MRIYVTSLWIVSKYAAGYQEDATEGRWINGETPPKAPRAVLEGSRVACPDAHDFCIDTKWSDGQTCLSPNPHLIKRCLDESCIRTDFGKNRSAQLLEDTYCKDFMKSEGRLCQWTEAIRCSCPSDIEDIVFANGVILEADNFSVPPGYKLASECVYPSNNMKRMPNGAYVDVPVPGGPPVAPIPDDPKLKGDPFWKDVRNVTDATVRPLAQVPPVNRVWDSSDLNGVALSPLGVVYAVIITALFSLYL